MSEIVYEHLDPERLRSQINSARRVSLFVRTSTDLVTSFDEEGEPDRAYTGMTELVQISQREAMRWAANHARFADLCEEGGKPRPKVRVGRSERCWFLG